jgi:enoyl-CoA hydratase
MNASRALAVELAAKAPLALRYAMEAVNNGLEMPFADACQFEAALFGMAAATEDMKEGTSISGKKESGVQRALRRIARLEDWQIGRLKC